MSEETIEGLADLEDFLTQMPNRIAKGAVQRVLRRGGQLIADKWRELARVRTRAIGHGPAGRFKLSIAVSSRLGRGGARWRASVDAPVAIAIVGPTADGYPEALTEEFGAHDARHNEPANAPGRRAWDAEAQAALDLIAAGLGPEIETTLARYVKRTGGG